jgi:hypothetical protein
MKIKKFIEPTLINEQESSSQYLLSPAEKDRLTEYLLLLIELDQKRKSKSQQKNKETNHAA